VICKLAQNGIAMEYFELAGTFPVTLIRLPVPAAPQGFKVELVHVGLEVSSQTFVHVLPPSIE